jgi:uncharacterized protein YdcH (DUF465 family)
MIKREISELRDELHSLINKNADYNEILKTSVELDKLIAEFINNKEKNDDKEKL